ncbi:L-arabinose isomerase [Halarsenatibacter silvermanii]|uniref:L-arabinose isomerase n=1 Tax=Halarsenatibacter silvermanii TaxID=321763 RepID=A0A1G9GUM0_9FIRM|nr:L-arabinose isomerase [Halarsenatibacter silvermanii]SDL04348.1 L-arabinose isomerase [Halarsenatibacter silvermanii]
MKISEYELWLVAGSQHLYGEKALEEVEENARKIVSSFQEKPEIPQAVEFKGVLTEAEEITALMREANADESCSGLIIWMHTFSPAQMWMKGLKVLEKPFVHLHTQFNRDIPWTEIDMDYMNINQSAHGGREFGYITARLDIDNKVIVGHWQEEEVEKELGVWARAAAAWQDMQEARIARFGDNMRRVAVTEGDKISARRDFGYSVEGFGLGDLTGCMEEITEDRIDRLIESYQQDFELAEELKPGGKYHQSLREQARIEAGLREFLKKGDFKAFTTTFENLHGLKQLPGLAVQRLMADGYGFGAEGDWKTAALVRAMKVMGEGLEGGSTFMEQYTYHLEPGRKKVLGAHMLEVCPTIAESKPRLEIHPLDIGGREDPVRAVFNSDTGRALNASVIDMGNRFRLIVNEVEAVNPEKELEKLPVARTLWRPRPDFKKAVKDWIEAGGAHHTGFSLALKPDHLKEFARIADLEFIEAGGG